MLFVQHLFVQLVVYLHVVHLLVISLLINSYIRKEIEKCKIMEQNPLISFSLIALARDVEKAVIGL